MCQKTLGLGDTWIGFMTESLYCGAATREDCSDMGLSQEKVCISGQAEYVPGGPYLSGSLSLSQGELLIKHHILS